ncbi:hypothetical protein ACIB24_00895 [Spongisporangium articulatum]|uniref:Esterase-like activity of phytase family protein n=1 Tax=Spongisporangium articulatum TaxID=3362603 RepID=A0ABW8AGY2_9ACTN
MRGLAAVLVGAFLCLGAAPTPGGSPTDESPTDRVVKDSRITESSGLARSLLHPGVLWTHNDSGNPPRLYAIGTDGRTAGVVTVDTPYDTDWEAMATLRGPDGRPLIAVADTGNNGGGREWAEILLVAEPKTLSADETVKPVRTLRFHYPGGSVPDVEALLAQPGTSHLFLVSKTLLTARMYMVPDAQWPARSSGKTEFTLQDVQRVDATVVTDGVFLPDGEFLLRGYGSLSRFPAPESGGKTLRANAVRTLPFQQQGESLTLTADGKQALIGSEGSRQAVLRVPLPVAGYDPSEQFGAIPSASPSVTATPELTAFDGSLGKLALAAGVVFVVLAGLALALTRRL